MDSTKLGPERTCFEINFTPLRSGLQALPQRIVISKYSALMTRASPANGARPSYS